MRKLLWILSLLLFIGAIVIWLFAESSYIEVRHLFIEGRSFGDKNASILQVSDLHIRQGDKQIEQMFEALQVLRMDAIVLTGDYVQWNGDYESALLILSKFKADKGVYAVMGDYDYSNARKSCLFCHEQGSGRPTKRHSVKFLRNSCDKVAIGKDTIMICGVDGIQANETVSPEVVKNLQYITSGQAAIVLSHSPLVFDLIDRDQDVLVLAGDTHGGQVPLPSWLWKLLGYEKNSKYEQGWFEEGRKRMYVNRGIGTSHFPIRFMRPPEITMFHFGEIGKNKVH